MYVLLFCFVLLLYPTIQGALKKTRRRNFIFLVISIVLPLQPLVMGISQPASDVSRSISTRASPANRSVSVLGLFQSPPKAVQRQF